MSLKGNTTEEQIWNYLKGKGMTDYGVAGLMGNLYAESGLRSNNLQNSYEKKLGMTDESYTKAVDSGSYTNFVKDSAGYGLAQWTYWSRKQALLEFVKSAKASIGDLETQLAFLCKELEGYKAVISVLKSAKSVRAASDAVLLNFERPADQSEAVQKKRAGYGQTYYDKYAKAGTTAGNGGNSMSRTRAAMANKVLSWLGKNEADGSHKEIIDIYNTLKPLPRGYKVSYKDAWCAATWSAAAAALGYTDIIPVECSCYYIIEQAKKMGIWQENDAYVPKIGDAVLYDWQDNGVGDNTGGADHIGTVVEVNGSTFVVVEGNYSNAVKKRTMSVNGRYIRGFICPKYTDTGTVQSVQTSGKSIDTVAKEVIAGSWGTGQARKTALEKAGYDYAKVQARVNEILNGSAATATSTTANSTTSTATKSVEATDKAQKYDKSLAGTYTTTANLYMRNGAGTNFKALLLIPKGTKVSNYGYYSPNGSTKWLYIQVVIDGVKYTGFSSGDYLKK